MSGKEQIYPGQKIPVGEPEVVTTVENNGDVSIAVGYTHKTAVRVPASQLGLLLTSVAAAMYVKKAIDYAAPPKTKVVVVSGPQGWGKTQYTQAIKEYLGAGVIIDGDEFQTSLTLDTARLATGGAVILTSAAGVSLTRIVELLEAEGFGVSVVKLAAVMKDIRANCDHHWVRHACPDIYQSDYNVCTKCGESKK